MNYTITEVSEATQDWENNYGQYRTFLVRFDGVEGQVQINRKKQADGSIKKPPTKGEALEGTIDTQDSGIRKFKQDYSGGSYQAKSTDDKPDEAYWADRNAKITRQHSQEMALRYIAVKGIESDMKTAEFLDKVVKPIINWFEEDAHSAEAPEVPFNG